MLACVTTSIYSQANFLIPFLPRLMTVRDIGLVSILTIPLYEQDATECVHYFTIVKYRPVYEHDIMYYNI